MIIMEQLKVKIKKLHPNAVIPAYSKPGDAGLDLVAVNVNYPKEESNLLKDNIINIDSGLSFEIPEGYLLVDREALLTMCREKVVDRKVGNIKEVYKLYNRQGRKDILTLVKISDLESIAYKKIIIDGKERNLSRP